MFWCQQLQSSETLCDNRDLDVLYLLRGTVYSLLFIEKLSYFGQFGFRVFRGIGTIQRVFY